jgi:hypothetical protein
VVGPEELFAAEDDVLVMLVPAQAAPVQNASVMRGSAFSARSASTNAPERGRRASR